MDLTSFEDVYFKACLKDWSKVSSLNKKIASRISRAKTLSIKSSDSDNLVMSIEGRRAAMCSGECNMPGGEVYTSPVEDSVCGSIYFPGVSVYEGKVMTNIRLFFKDGRITDCEASTGRECLETIVESDANVVGEFGIGTNFSLKKRLNDSLFDEKIGGTIHVGLGAGFRECGGNSDNDDHWDLICDMRRSGTNVKLGRRMLMKSGRIT
jgi:aminopeptidase